MLALTTEASPEDWRQVEDLFDRIRNCGESGGHTESDAYSMYTFKWMANKVWGQVRVCQWKVHACGESECTSVTLWLSILICSSSDHLVQCLCGVTLHE